MAPVTEFQKGHMVLRHFLEFCKSTHLRQLDWLDQKNLTTDKNLLICECVLYFFFEWAKPLMGKNSNPGKCKKHSLHSVHIAGLCM